MFPNRTDRCMVGLTEGNTLTEAVESVDGAVSDEWVVAGAITAGHNLHRS